MNAFDEARLFKKLWALWPNQDKEHAAKKALKVLLHEEDIDPDRLVASANIYAMELRGHCHELGNWLRNDIWKDIYIEFRDVFEYEAKLKARRDEAVSVIEHWKEHRLDWWCSISSVEAHIKQVEFALRYKPFRDHWKDAFSLLLKLFAEPFDDGDWRAKITPSITWFCKVDYDSSTVTRIIEGEFGKIRTKKAFNAAKLFPKRDQMDSDEAIQKLKSIFQKQKPKEEDLVYKSDMVSDPEGWTAPKELEKPKANMNSFLQKLKQNDRKPKSRFGFDKAKTPN